MRTPLLLFFACLLAVAAPAQAASVAEVEIVGLDEEMTENVRVSLSAVDAIGRQVPPRRIEYLVRVAEEETREALAPFGYYSPEISIQRSGRGDDIALTITVDPGEPVRVRHADIAIVGEGGKDRYLKRDLARFKPAQGEVFDHATYEKSKLRITHRLAERGYFDADFASRRVEVTRADNAADIDLAWTSGARYDMGPTTFEQSPEAIIRESLLRKLLYWNEGEYYHQGRLDRLRKSLVRLDYFSQIDIQPLPGEAVNKRVPVQVTLKPAKRTIYTVGLSYGSESGAGVSLGLERRYVNDRGHKALAQLDYAENLKSLTLQYRIPAFAWLDGWYTFSLKATDEMSKYIDDRRVEFVAARSGEINQHLNAVVSLHALRERWYFQVADDGGALAEPDYRYASLLYPQLRGEYIDVDDRLFPTRGIGGSLRLAGAVEGAGSDASFGQVQARATWFKGLGERNRLIVRGEIGHTFVDLLTDLPPSLRFYAGGDRSIRGYEFREVGPSIAIDGGERYSTGARNLVTASVEFERYFNPTWGGAVFVDGGDAFNGSTPDWHVGVGIGVRYRSPVGPIKFDIARGLDDPNSPFTIGLSIGADF
ncbi:autotransporter assembly complex family protein [Luteimonas vadosa]|uniref:Translocation and assembly module subunit TamA n=1 Tax=Luteimonas vadosa TaxID=1165507 RepID=A0ABP9DQ23_9GAMM